MKIFILSLPVAAHRRRVVADKMQQLGLSFTFFDAIDGRKGVPSDYKHYINRPAMERNLRRTVSDAEVCCALSHALLYQHIADNNISHSIILEDDFLCESHFADVVNQAVLENHTSGFILLYHLYARILEKQKQPFFAKYSIAPVINNCAGAVGYYIDLATATKFASVVFPISYVSDWFLDITALPAQVCIPRLITHPSLGQSQMENIRKQHNRNRFSGQVFGRLGFLYTVRYKIKKPFSVVVSETVEGK